WPAPSRSCDNLSRVALLAEPPIPVLVAPDRPHEIDLAEGGPVGVAEVELAVGALPQHEAREAHLPAGPDDQVRVGSVLGVEVLLDRVRRQIAKDVLG